MIQNKGTSSNKNSQNCWVAKHLGFFKENFFGKGRWPTCAVTVTFHAYSICQEWQIHRANLLKSKWTALGPKHLIPSSLQCRRFVFERAICSRNFSLPEVRRKWGESKGVILSPSHLIFLCHKINDGGYNNITNTNNVSPTQNTPALQARSRLKQALSKWWQQYHTTQQWESKKKREKGKRV